MKKLLIIIFIFLISYLNSGCYYIKKNMNLDFTGDNLKYPVSFTSYLYDIKGKIASQDSTDLKIIKTFKISMRIKKEPYHEKIIDLSDTLNSLIEKNGADGIINFSITNAGHRIPFGQYIGSTLNLVTIPALIWYSNIYTHILFWSGFGMWFISTDLLKEESSVLMSGTLVKWNNH